MHKNNDSFSVTQFLSSPLFELILLDIENRYCNILKIGFFMNIFFVKSLRINYNHQNVFTRQKFFIFNAN